MVTATAPTTTRMRLQKLRIQNYMRVELAEIALNGNHLKISGRHATGKSSILKGWMDAIQGHSKRDGAEPVHEGADRAVLHADLGPIIIDRIIPAEGSQRLKITAADGSSYGKTQEMLDRLIGKPNLDPLAFLKSTPRQMVDLALKRMGVECPVAEVQELTGERFPALPGELADAYLQRLCGDMTGVFYVRRTETGRVADSKRHAVQEQESVLLNAGGTLAEDEKPQSASEILTELDELGQLDQDRRELFESASESRDAFEDVQKQLDDLKSQYDASRKEIARLKALLSSQEQASVNLGTRIVNGEKECARLEKEANEALKRCQLAEDPSAKITAARERLKAVEQTNESIRLRQTHRDQLGRFQKESAVAIETHRRIENILQDLRALKSKILKGAKLGIPGLEVGEGELRLNGKPFHTQASTAEQARVACRLAMNPDSILRVIVVDGAESLDYEMLGLVIQEAQDNDYQVIFSEVDREAEALSFEIVEA